MEGSSSFCTAFILLSAKPKITLHQLSKSPFPLLAGEFLDNVGSNGSSSSLGNGLCCACSRVSMRCWQLFDQATPYWAVRLMTRPLWNQWTIISRKRLTASDFSVVFWAPVPVKQLRKHCQSPVLAPSVGADVCLPSQHSPERNDMPILIGPLPTWFLLNRLCCCMRAFLPFFPIPFHFHRFYLLTSG